jgi:hypothetical protein
VLHLRNAPAAQGALFATGMNRDDHLRFLKRTELKDEINWVVEKAGERVGLGGIYSIDVANRRAEGGRLAAVVPDAHLFNTFITAYVVFEVLKFNRVYGQALTSNIVSNKSMERFGMVKEGVLREHVWKDGKPCDVTLYALVASDWRRIKPGLVARYGQPEIIRSVENEMGELRAPEPDV